MDWKLLIAELTQAGFSQQQIAAACNCGQASISELATGKTVNPSYSLGVNLTSFHKKKVRKKQPDLPAPASIAQEAIDSVAG